MTLEKGLAAFLDMMLGKNRSAATLRAYRTDILQFITFLHENNVAITGVGDVGKVDVLEYLAAFARKGLTGVARARKVSAIREYFRFLEGVGCIQKSPTTGIDTPKREKHTRQFLRSDEYTKMLSLAGGHPRDYAILQVFLQTGIRVSELAHLTIEDVDFIKPAIKVRGKGNQEREIALEKRGVQALKNYLAVRPENLSDVLFFNYKGEPISERGIRKLVVKYRKNAGITKRASCHTLRCIFHGCLPPSPWEGCHSVHVKAATQSTGCLPLSPREGCHVDQGKVATHSRRSLPLSERSDAGRYIVILRSLLLSTSPAVSA